MKKYNKRKNLHPCRLHKSDLIELVNLIKTDFPVSEREDDLEINSKIGDYNITENTLEKFFDHKNLPNIISFLSIRQMGWSSERQIDKYVSLTFYDSFISLDVDGDSESWVKGKYVQICDFLNDKKPLFWFLKTNGMALVMGAIFPLSILIIGFSVEIIRKHGIRSLGVWLPLTLIFFSILHIVTFRFHYIKIYLDEKKNYFERNENFLILIGIIGSIFTIIASVFQVLSDLNN